MSIHIDSCAELETIVAKTRSSVYGLRMRFIVPDGPFVTWAVESLSRRLASAASPECAQRIQPGVLNATS